MPRPGFARIKAPVRTIHKRRMHGFRGTHSLLSSGTSPVARANRPAHRAAPRAVSSVRPAIPVAHRSFIPRRTSPAAPRASPCCSERTPLVVPRTLPPSFRRTPLLLCVHAHLIRSARRVSFRAHVARCSEPTSLVIPSRRRGISPARNAEIPGSARDGMRAMRIRHPAVRTAARALTLRGARACATTWRRFADSLDESTGASSAVSARPRRAPVRCNWRAHSLRPCCSR